jgi:hypothetical protein
MCPASAPQPGIASQDPPDVQAVRLSPVLSATEYSRHCPGTPFQSGWATIFEADPGTPVTRSLTVWDAGTSGGGASADLTTLTLLQRNRRKDQQTGGSRCPQR